MCSPIAAAAFVAQGVGSAMNAQSQANAMRGTLALERDAMNQRKGFLDSEYGRQAQFVDSNKQIFDKSNAQFKGNVSDEMAAKAAAIKATYNPQVTGSPIRGTAPKAVSIVADAEGDFRNQAQGRVENLAGALANLRSFNDVFTEKNRGIARGSQDITQGLDAMRGSRGVLNSELQSAQVSPLAYQLQSANAMNPLGDLLRGAGQIGMYYGLADPSKVAANRAGGVVPTTPTPSYPSFVAPPVQG